MPPPPRSSLFPYTTLFRSNVLPENGIRRSTPNEVNLCATAFITSCCRPPRVTSFSDGSSWFSRMRERSEEHTSELQSQFHLVCRLLLEKKKILNSTNI